MLKTVFSEKQVQKSVTEAGVKLGQVAEGGNLRPMACKGLFQAAEWLLCLLIAWGMGHGGGQFALCQDMSL